MTVPGNTTPGTKITSMAMLPQNVKDWADQQGIELDLSPEEPEDKVSEDEVNTEVKAE